MHMNNIHKFDNLYIKNLSIILIIIKSFTCIKKKSHLKVHKESQINGQF